eukprot:13320288-Alexandrium_andersonii.AAC.1
MAWLTVLSHSGHCPVVEASAAGHWTLSPASVRDAQAAAGSEPAGTAAAVSAVAVPALRIRM